MPTTPDRLEIVLILLGCGLLTLAITALLSTLLSGFTWSGDDDDAGEVR